MFLGSLEILLATARGEIADEQGARKSINPQS
jgi:hypothetical protein